MKIVIKNMVCDRCISSVSRLCADISLAVRKVELGSVDFVDPLSDEQMAALRAGLEAMGFEVLDDPDAEMVERIKRELIAIARSDEPLTVKLSVALSQRIGVNFRTLSRLFSEAEGRTIENYFILQKIERVKELMAYGRQSLSEIAYQCGYSSVAHLSRQFRQITGLTPTQFRSAVSRKPLDKI